MKKFLVRMALSLMGSGWLRWLLSEYLFPLLSKLVEQTSNQYDDEALVYVKEMLLSLADMLEAEL